MTHDAFQVLRFIFGWGYRFLTGFKIPGTNITPAALLFLILFVSVAIRFIRSLTDVKSTVSDKKSGD